MPCLRLMEERVDAYTENDLRRVGECNREMLRHPHKNRPGRTGQPQ
ncbi:hypothetical protein ACFYN0_06870 [Streptomyces sp. NPDC006704]